VSPERIQTDYLVRSGAPVFKHIALLDRYTDVLEEPLRRAVARRKRAAPLCAQEAAPST
jgi:hypothetical protein